MLLNLENEINPSTEETSARILLVFLSPLFPISKFIFAFLLAL